MRLYLYRTREHDEEGDPLDWGAIRAMTPEHAASYARTRFARLGLTAPLDFNIYSVRGQPTGTMGVMGNGKVWHHTWEG